MAHPCFRPAPTLNTSVHNNVHSYSFEINLKIRQLELVKLKVKDEPRSQIAKVSERKQIIKNFDSAVMT